MQKQDEMEAAQKQLNDRVIAINKELLDLNTLKEELVETKRKLNNTYDALEVQRIVEDEINKKSGVVQNKIRKTAAEVVKEGEQRMNIRMRKMAIEESQERASKMKNILIHRSDESLDNDGIVRKRYDSQIVKELFDTCEVNLDPKEHIVNVFRLGKKEEGKKRPILVQLKEENVKKELFQNLWKLKNAPDRIANISVGHDMTKEEREETKRLVGEAKRLAKQNPDFKYKLKGPPWKRFISKVKIGISSTKPWVFSCEEDTSAGEKTEVVTNISGKAEGTHKEQ